MVIRVFWVVSVVRTITVIHVILMELGLLRLLGLVGRQSDISSSYYASFDLLL